MKLETRYMPVVTDTLFDAKLKLLRGVWQIDTFRVPRTHTMMRFIFYDPLWSRFAVRLEQGKVNMVVGVKWGEPIDAERAVWMVATKHSFTGILLGCVRRKVVSERQFWEYVRVRGEWFY